MSILLDGVQTAKRFVTQAEYNSIKFACDYNRKPKLAIVSIGNNPASKVYMRNKVRACDRAAISCEIYEYDCSYTQLEIESEIKHLNSDDTIDGIIVQLPVPTFYDADRLISLISPDKDVDGLSDINQGYTFTGSDKGFRPCTPKGIIAILFEYGISLDGKHVVIIGRSQLVGKPLAAMMTDKHATVTLCHSRTRNLDKYTREADIIVCAVGKPDFITSDMIKPGAVIVDVGINKVDGNIVGDCSKDLGAKAAYITPVPGGIGPMTVAMLVTNTVEAAYGHCKSNT